MTSTVLDVTVLLLCVSASVVALGAVDGDRGAAEAEAGEAADLIATETVTVTYASDEAPNGTRTVHATRAELVALVAAEGGGDGEEHARREAFESEALSAVERGIGPRTRIDAEVEMSQPKRAANESGGGAEGPSSDAAAGASRRSPNESALLSGPGRWNFGSDGVGQNPTGATGTGVPWRIDREEGGGGRSETERREIGAEPPGPIAVGSEPPRGAEVTAAVITHPIPNDSGSIERVRIVIRRW
ncbi:DUF7284 family protein [Halorubrum lipolyticum]|uniref:Uncharacterized protein n=1 Tax=Halorubrum lipolyticum DSM 21995 TaxID=1227482 RepID=M0NX48_9EURY|nr:hypothetical protein [Halorubrum lipolyticum]EMA61155.1 hypothetical protein C469_07787 [Halorubrum lipolyticum DSM 21995]